MVGIISKTKKYVTVRLPLELAYARNILQREPEHMSAEELRIAQREREIEEVEPTASEKKAIKIAKKQFANGDFISMQDYFKKHGW